MHALILDDSRAMRQILKRIIAPLGFEVVEASSGAEALQALSINPNIELALVDWNMPQMTGIDFIQAVRRVLRNRRIKMVMVTTESDPSKVASALEQGADEFITKPFAFEELLQKLKQIGVKTPAMV